jgi:hypothetical protein
LTAAAGGPGAATRWLRVTIVSLAFVVVGAFLPWVASGEAERNSFATVRAARALDLVGNSFGDAVLAAWFVVPLAAALVLLFALVGRRRWAEVVAGVVGLVAVAFAGVVIASPVETRAGVYLTLVAGLLAIVGAVVSMRSRQPAG